MERPERSAARTAMLLFGFGLCLRLLFWHAGPDGGAVWHIGFKGDAAIWQDFALRLANGIPDAELRLPWRPPAMLWLLANTWDGTASAFWLRGLFVVLGAAVAPLLWLLLRRRVDDDVAWLAAGLCAASSNLMLAGSGVQVEGLYLPLVLLALLGQARMATPHRIWLPVCWGAGNGLLCLLRAEHLAFFAAFLLVAMVCRLRWRSLLLAVLGCSAVLLPWQLQAKRMIDEFNATGPPSPALSLPWDQAATDAVLELPAFARRAVFEVVDATVRHRGGARVAVADLAIVREAYGCWPEPLPVPLIALYGALNFFVANAAEAERGGTWAALDREPLLSGGADRYPGWLRLAPGRHRQFSLDYPPHLDVAVHGYARGLDEILADPAAWCGRAMQKLWQLMAGATGGLGGYALPIGMSGVRRPIDMVVAEGVWPGSWRGAVVLFAILGLWSLRRHRALWPLLAFTVAKIGLVVLFFGQARHGVQCLPAVAIGVAAALLALPRRWPRLRLPPAGLTVFGLLLVLEFVRAGSSGATVDGHPVAGLEPYGPQDIESRVIEFR
ncbi:MAG: hypothetical protein KDC98_21585 [Planctomycetes bacterium]|nr:hypothetical protein [Planctomycetota bacterium]